MSAKRSSLLLISGAILVFVLLFISPRRNPDSKSSTSIEGSNGTKASTPVTTREDMRVYVNLALKALTPELLQKHKFFLKETLLDSLVLFWDKQKRPDLASFFMEETAEKKDSAALWFKAGNRYYYSIPFVNDESETPLLYQRALFCFDKSQKKDSSNVDAQIMYASCLVESSSDPMKGISLLRNIEQLDSNNLKLQMTFALFSVRSGQLDKAIRRFKKVLQLDSSAIEVYLHLADSYEKLKQPEKSIEMLEKYKSKTNDPLAKLEIGKYIEQLKNSN